MNWLRLRYLNFKLWWHRRRAAPAPDQIGNVAKMKSLTVKPIQLELGFELFPSGAVHQLGRDGRSRKVTNDEVIRLVHEEYAVLYELARQEGFRGGPPKHLTLEA